MSEPSKKPDPPKKPEPRSAGASTTKNDVFTNPLPEFPEHDANAANDDPANDDPANDDPAEKKVTFTEMVREKFEKPRDLIKETRRKSMNMLTGMGNKDEGKNDETEDGGSNTK